MSLFNACRITGTGSLVGLETKFWLNISGPPATGALVVGVRSSPAEDCLELWEEGPTSHERFEE